MRTEGDTELSDAEADSSQTRFECDLHRVALPHYAPDACSRSCHGIALSDFVGTLAACGK
jgi:hypothetical protein